MSSERTVHVPVMVHEVLDQLALRPGLTIVDGTLGAGGHSQRILQQMSPDSRLIGLDRDPAMISRAAQIVLGDRVTLQHASYAQLDAVLDELGIATIDRVLLDLGLSSDQLADPARGFGFDTSGELDMRFDVTTGVSAADWISQTSQEGITTALREYGEEPQAALIAQKLVELRSQRQPVRTADQLKNLIEQIAGHPPGKSHPATRVFQALRIVVNQELDQLQTFLTDVLPRRLAPGGRALIITFHSLEDRLVKQAFRDSELWENLTRKPLTATPSEVRWNPRSRSAKLRVATRKESVT